VSIGDGTVEALQRHEDKAGILKTREFVHGLIKKEIDGGIASDRIIVGGFSQGGAMSMLSALSYDKKLAAALVLSGWMLLGGGEFDNLVTQENKQTPIFMGHGKYDPLVPYEMAKLSYNKLKEMGYKVALAAYE
jgi:lysophospholipase I